MKTTPYKYRGFWLWRYDGYYDVHAATEEPCSSSVLAEGMTLKEAKRYVNYSLALEMATNFPEFIIGKVR